MPAGEQAQLLACQPFETRNWLTMRGFEEELKAMAQRRWRKGKG
jgi:hypothetical protein